MELFPVALCDRVEDHVHMKAVVAQLLSKVQHILNDIVAMEIALWMGPSVVASLIRTAPQFRTRCLRMQVLTQARRVRDHLRIKCVNVSGMYN